MDRRCWCGAPAAYRADTGAVDCLTNRRHDWRGLPRDRYPSALPWRVRLLRWLTFGPDGAR